MKKKILRQALLDTAPVMAGYVFLGFGFGLLLRRAGYGLGWALAMSLFIFAGSMQYVAVGLLTAGAGLATAALTTLLVNARHLFYGVSMVEAYRGAGWKKPYLIFALTDETYSLVCQGRTPPGADRHSYCLLLSALDQSYWVTGSALGSLAGAVLPVDLPGVEFVLTALFVTIFTEQWLTARDHRPALTGLLITAGCRVVFGSEVFLIPAMILIALVLAIPGKEKAHA